MVRALGKRLGGLRFRVRVYIPPSVDRIWGIWGSYYNIPKAVFYLPSRDYQDLGFRVYSSGGRTQSAPTYGRVGWSDPLLSPFNWYNP